MAAAFACVTAVTASSARADDAGTLLVLSDTQLDRVTAAGSFEATADAFVTAFGTNTLTDTLTDSSVGPQGGQASASGLGLGDDDATGSVLTTVIGAEGNVVQTADGFGTGGSTAGNPLALVAGAQLTANDNGVSGNAEVNAAGEFGTASAFVALTDPNTGDAVVFSAFDSISEGGDTASAQAGGSITTRGPVTTLKAGFGGSGSTAADGLVSVDTTTSSADEVTGFVAANGTDGKLSGTTVMRTIDGKRVQVTWVRSSGRASASTNMEVSTNVTPSSTPQVQKSFNRTISRSTRWGNVSTAHSATLLITKR